MKDKKAYYLFGDTGMLILGFLIIAIGISAGIYLYYSSKIDVRIDEAKILTDKIFMAVVKKGNLNEKIFSGDFDILKEARIDKKVIDNGDYYFKVDILKENEKSIVFEQGFPDYEVECFLSGRNFPECYSREFEIFRENKKIKIKILTASNQLGGMV